MQIEAGPAATGLTRSPHAPDGGLPVFHAAGDAVAGEFLCAECGYGVSVRSALPFCPMCRGSVWEEPGGGRHLTAPL